MRKVYVYKLKDSSKRFRQNRITRIDPLQPLSKDNELYEQNDELINRITFPRRYKEQESSKEPQKVPGML